MAHLVKDLLSRVKFLQSDRLSHLYRNCSRRRYPPLRLFAECRTPEAKWIDTHCSPPTSVSTWIIRAVIIAISNHSQKSRAMNIKGPIERWEVSQSPSCNLLPHRMEIDSVGPTVSPQACSDSPKTSRDFCCPSKVQWSMVYCIAQKNFRSAL